MKIGPDDGRHRGGIFSDLRAMHNRLGPEKAAACAVALVFFLGLLSVLTMNLLGTSFALTRICAHAPA